MFKASARKIAVSLLTGLFFLGQVTELVAAGNNVAFSNRHKYLYILVHGITGDREGWYNPEDRGKFLEYLKKEYGLDGYVYGYTFLKYDGYVEDYAREAFLAKVLLWGMPSPTPPAKGLHLDKLDDQPLTIPRALSTCRLRGFRQDALKDKSILIKRVDGDLPSPKRHKIITTNNYLHAPEPPL